MKAIAALVSAVNVRTVIAAGAGLFLALWVLNMWAGAALFSALMWYDSLIADEG